MADDKGDGTPRATRGEAATSTPAPDEGSAGAEDAPSGGGRAGERESEGGGEDGEEVAAHTTEARTLSPRVRIGWAARLLVGVAVLAAFARFAFARLGVDPRLAPALAGVLGVLGLAWVHLRYRAWSYRLRSDALYLERGVLTQVRTVAPHVRIQHVDTSRGPLERALGLSTLVVYTAGSRGADVSVPGLAPEEASDLQRRLKKLAIETGGGDAL
jgi:membrane protein YdbS with pleckstrin-like domain